MPKVTKKAKSVDVIVHECVVTESWPSYRCPSCLIEFHGAGPGPQTTRFICECGQELIVKGRKVVKEA